MKLKFNKSINESQVTVVLSLTNNTVNEKKAIKILGAPQITLEKTYPISQTTVTIDANVSDFNIEYSFNGTVDNISEVIDEANTFVIDVQEKVTDAMKDLMTAYKTIEKQVASQSGELEIKDGEPPTKQ